MPDGTVPNMMPVEMIAANDRTVACDGGAAALGHPRIFMTIEKDRVMCPYCSRIYVLKARAGHGSGH
jgi:uncharacterized Zn-finger protein